jgi:hypothetical protein
MEKNTKLILDEFDLCANSIDISNRCINGFLDLKNFKKLRHLNCSYNKITEIVNLPRGLEWLDCSFNLQEQIIYLPHSLTYVNLESNPIAHFQNITNIKPYKYPDTLIKLELGKTFNKPIDNLPESLRELVIGKNYNLPIENLPTGLVSLKFSEDSIFNQSINFLPESLKILVLGKDYNMTIDSLPNGLEKLIISRSYDKTLSCLSVSTELIKIVY